MIRVFLLLLSAYGVLGNCPDKSLINQTTAPLKISEEGYSPSMTVLKSGRALAVFRDDNDDRYYGHLMESDGTLVGDKISLTLVAAGKRRLRSHGYSDFDIAPFKNGFLTVQKYTNQFLVAYYDNNGARVNSTIHFEHDQIGNLEKIHLVVFSDDSFAVAYGAPMAIRTDHFSTTTKNLPNERVQWFNSDLTKRGSPTVSPRYDTPWTVVDPAWTNGWMEHHERIIGAVALEGDRLMTFVWNQHYNNNHPVKNRIHCHIYEKNGTIAKWLVLNPPTSDDSLRYWHVKAHPGGFRAQRKNEVNVFKVHSNLTFSKTANILPDGLKYLSSMDKTSEMVDYASGLVGLPPITSELEINDLDVKPIVDGTIVATYKVHDDDQFYIALYNDGNLASGPYTIGGDSGDYEVHQAKGVTGDNLIVLYEYSSDGPTTVFAGIYKLDLCGEQPFTPQGGQPTPTATPDGEEGDGTSTNAGIVAVLMLLVVAVVGVGLRASFVNENNSNPRKKTVKIVNRAPRTNYQPVRLNGITS